MTTMALFVFLIMLFSPLLYADGEIQSKLDKLSKTLVAGYEASFPGSERASLAVLPFHTDKELAKRRTGLALAELLTHSFRQYDKFRIVERIELNRIFEELGGNAEDLGNKQSDALKTHTHDIGLLYRPLRGNSGGTLFTTPNEHIPYTLTTSGPSTGKSPETRPRNYAMTPCIKH